MVIIRIYFLHGILIFFGEFYSVTQVAASYITSLSCHITFCGDVVVVRFSHPHYWST